MSREWNDSQPIYRQLRDRGVHMILDGVQEFLAFAFEQQITRTGI